MEKKLTRQAMENTVFTYFNEREYTGPLIVIVHCIVSDPSNDCLCPQLLNFNVDGAGELNLLSDLIDVLEGSYDLEFQILHHLA